MRKHDGDPANSRPSDAHSTIAPACLLPRGDGSKAVGGSGGDGATDRRRKVPVTGLARFFGCLALANLALWCAATDARSLTLDEFDRLSAQSQEDSILTILEYYYESALKMKDRSISLKCITERNRLTAENGRPYFTNLVFLEIDSARNDRARPQTIEEIVATVVDRECRT